MRQKPRLYFSSNTKNERKNMRRSVQIDCQVVRERDFKLIGSRTLDLSPDGLLIPSMLEDVAPDDELIVSFQATAFGIWFDTEARVARVINGRRSADRGLAIGVKFDSLDSVKRLILRGQLAKVPPPLPQRPSRFDLRQSVYRALH